MPKRRGSSTRGGQRSKSGRQQAEKTGSLHQAAWPNALENLQSAYTELAKVRTQLETRIAEIDETRDLFGQVVESMSEAFLLLDVSGRIVRANGAAGELFGGAPDSLVGRPLREACPELEVPKTPWELMERSPDGHLADLDAELERSATERVHLSVSASVVRSKRGRITGTLIVARDITERHLAAQKLARSNQELEVFAHVASHDLQEPLRMIASYLQLLEMEYEPLLDEEGKQYVDFAVEGAKRMQQLILGLLDYSRVGRKPMTLAPVSAEHVVDLALANLKVAIEETGARVERSKLPEVMGDEIQLVQVFQNLIGNSLKFRGDEPLVVSVRAESHGPYLVRFDVADNGIGIEKEFAERVFQIFERLHTQEAYPGTGIGLAICKKTVERHGGRIWLRDDVLEGATFSFTLRAAAPEGA